MHYLEIKHLRMIQMIAMTNNLTKAAEKLFVSQSALSQQLKNVEGKIGANIFFRNGQKMILTKIGKKLVNSAQTIIDEIDKTEHELAHEINGEKGELKVGVRCVFCFKWIPLVIKQFQDKYPNVNLVIGKSMQPEEELMSNTFDITISSANITNQRISYTPLFETEFVCVMSCEYPLNHKKYMEIEDFEGADMISIAEKSSSSFYAHFKDKGIKLRRFMTVPYPETIVDLAEAGLGIAILPKWFVSSCSLTKNLHSCHFTSKKHILQMKAHYLKEKTVLPYQGDFINMIVSQSIKD